jgi:hypothetical protein
MRLAPTGYEKIISNSFVYRSVLATRVAQGLHRGCKEKKKKEIENEC